MDPPSPSQKGQQAAVEKAMADRLQIHANEFLFIRVHSRLSFRSSCPFGVVFAHLCGLRVPSRFSSALFGFNGSTELVEVGSTELVEVGSTELVEVGSTELVEVGSTELVEVLMSAERLRLCRVVFFCGYSTLIFTHE
jgi:hypothetical protein